MRLRRKRRILRAVQKSFQLTEIVNNTDAIRPGDVLLFATVRNEDARLPYFLKYYRQLGVRHFLFVDNDSTDKTHDLLVDQPDISLWYTKGSYKRASFGVDWLNWLQKRYGHGHWTLVVDADEFFVYPFCDTRPLRALTDWLDASSLRSFGAMVLDVYPKGPFHRAVCAPGQDPLEVAPWFDAGNYTIERNPLYGNLWIQGGPRARVFFADRPQKAPALNKIPLVKWDRRYTYISSTHMMLPRGLNRVYDEWGGEKTSGVLLHPKFLNTFPDKAAEELKRREHYDDGVEYQAYASRMPSQSDLWCQWSEKYINWRQLEILGLMSKGNWA